MPFVMAQLESAGKDAAFPISQPDAQQGSLELSLNKYKAAEALLHTSLVDVFHAVQRESQELAAARAALAAERAALEEEKARVLHVFNAEEQVVLNVGGVRFTTTVTTLRNAPAPSLFSAMFSGRHPIKRDDTGCVFIDRDGRHFHVVLNFLRDGCLNTPPPPDGADFQYLLELRAEAEFYGLVGMLALIDRYPYGLVVLHRAVSVNTEDTWIYEGDGPDEVVLTVDRPCHLLGVGLCGTDSSFTVDFTVYEVDPADFDTQLCELSKHTHSFTKADGKVVRLMLPAPVVFEPQRTYMLQAGIQGQDSFCCEECLETVVAGGVKVMFKPWESPNGTNELRGQFPELLIRPLATG